MREFLRSLFGDVFASVLMIGAVCLLGLGVWLLANYIAPSPLRNRKIAVVRSTSESMVRRIYDDEAQVVCYVISDESCYIDCYPPSISCLKR